VKHTHTIQLFLFFLLLSMSSFAQTSDEVLRLLLQKGLVTQAEVDSLQAKEKQTTQSKDKTFFIGIEFKPRYEYRNGYRYLREDSTQAASLVLGRSRINITYIQDRKFKFHTSLQDIRVWGQYDPRYSGATVQIFESYVEAYLTPRFFTRIGRQRIMLDNERLFAQNDWRPNGGAHDGLSFHYADVKPERALESSIYGSFNQLSADQFFDTDLYTAALGGSTWSNYKYLGVFYLKYQKADFTYTTINSIDGFQDKTVADKHYNRYTNGGRLEWTKGNFYATFSGYYQWGNNTTGKELKAWYIQPEIKYTNKKYKNNVRLGLEVLGGKDNTNKTNGTDNSFSPLYGVAHRFNGYMDFFTTFPADLNNAGLVNPYLFLTQNIGSKFSLQAHFHFFYAQNKLLNSTGQEMQPYLGFENDFVVQYKPNAYTAIDLGLCYANLTSSAAAMKQPTASALSQDPNNKSTGGNPDLIPMFGYLQIRFTPEIFRAKF